MQRLRISYSKLGKVNLKVFKMPNSFAQSSSLLFCILHWLSDGTKKGFRRVRGHTLSIVSVITLLSRVLRECDFPVAATGKPETIIFSLFPSMKEKDQELVTSSLVEAVSG